MAKSFLWKSRVDLETFQRLSAYIQVSYKFVLKSFKSLNRIFCTTEYWFNALECQICTMSKKSFFWESKTNLGTLQKLSHYIGVSYNFLFLFFFEVCLKPKSNVLSDSILVQGSTIPSLVDKCKTIFLGN